MDNVPLSIKCVFTSFDFADQLSNKILVNCVQRILITSQYILMYIVLNNVYRMIFIEISFTITVGFFGCSTTKVKI